MRRNRCLCEPSRCGLGAGKARPIWRRRCTISPRFIAPSRVLGRPFLYYQRALRIRESLYGANAVELVPVLNGLATAYLETRNRKQAERLFRRAETIDLQNFSEDDLRLGQDAYNAGVLALERKHYVIAEGRFKQSAAIFIKRLPPNDPEIGNVACGPCGRVSARSAL